MIFKILQKILQSLSLGKQKTDPLDALLIEKGMDPDEVMEDVYTQRNMEGDSNAIYRAINRFEVKKERAERIRKKTNLGGNIGA